MASIKVSALVVEARGAPAATTWRRPSSAQDSAGFTIFNNSALTADEEHEVLGDLPSASTGVDIPSNCYLSGIEATPDGAGDIDAEVVFPFDLSGAYTFVIHIALKKTVAGTFTGAGAANVRVELQDSAGSYVTHWIILQSDISVGPTGWHSITITAPQLAEAIAENDTHISVSISNDSPV